MWLGLQTRKALTITVIFCIELPSMPSKKATNNTKPSLSLLGIDKCSAWMQAALEGRKKKIILQPVSYFSPPQSQQFSAGSAAVLHFFLIFTHRIIKAIFKVTTEKGTMKGGKQSSYLLPHSISLKSTTDSYLPFFTLITSTERTAILPFSILPSASAAPLGIIAFT